VLKIGARFLRIDPTEWGLKVDLSFGPPGDWQLETWQRVLDNLPHDMPFYASDVFWPCEAKEYREKFLQPQLGLFETATTLSHIESEGGTSRERLRTARTTTHSPYHLPRSHIRGISENTSSRQLGE
jgi:hypothetical protein